MQKADPTDFSLACPLAGAKDVKPPFQPGAGKRGWIAEVVAFMDEERRRSSDTPLLRIDCPELPAIDLYLKDESAHPSGSLKHRLAHSLFLLAVCDGRIGPATPIVEASSGSTAISEAWFARRLGLPFIAVVPERTAPAKIAAIREMGGSVETVGPSVDIRRHAANLAERIDGFFMDQFGRAADATDWRGANNIAQSLFGQLAGERHPIPAWVVVGAGTGGTSLTIGRYIRLTPELRNTRLCVVDPEGSAFFQAWCTSDRAVRGRSSTVVEGIGRAQVEPAFNLDLIDNMLSVSDSGSVAGAHWLERRIGRRFGPSTGTNIIGSLVLAHSLQCLGRPASVVTLGCDRGDRYSDTIYDPVWIQEQKLDPAGWHELLAQLGRPAFPGQPN